MYRLLLSVLWLILPVSAHAAIGQPVAFSRGTVMVVPVNPKQADYKGGVLFNVDIRDFGSVHNPTWFDFASFSENKGLLLTLAFSAPITIYPVNHFAKMDILMLDDYGTVMKILPNIALANLSEPVASGTPVLAVLYLKGGMVDTLGVQPGDVVRYKIFRKHPEVRTIDMPPKTEIEKPKVPEVKAPEPVTPTKVEDTNLNMTPIEDKAAQEKRQNDLVDSILNRHHQQ